MEQLLYRMIGERIRRARENLKLSQQDLARRLGYASAATISYFESGERKIGIADLQKLSALLGLPLTYFFEQPTNTARGGELERLRFRAQEVLPTAREMVVGFLSFARRHGAEARRLSINLSGLKPWEAAACVRHAAGAEAIPVSPNEVAERLGIPIFEWDFPPEISGVLVCDGERYCIGVNEDQPRVRQRFTVAHELGHWAMDGNRDFFDYVEVEFTHFSEASTFQRREEDAQYEEMERRANQFAADLLMPAESLCLDVAEHGIDVLILARRYGVSQHALWSRLRGLRLDENATKALD